MTAEPRGPIRTVATAVPDVCVRELGRTAALSLRAGAAAAQQLSTAWDGPLPGASTWARINGWDVLWLGPDEWLVLVGSGDPAEATHVLHSAMCGHPGAVVDVSGQRRVIEVDGERAADVLAKGCSLDLHRAVRPAGTCLTTLLAQAGVTIVVRDAGFSLLVRRSFADYVLAWLADAAREID